MRGSMRRVAVIGEMDLAVAEALRTHGYRADVIDGTSVVAIARDLIRMRPAVVHARSAHLKAGVVSRLLNLPLVVQAVRTDVNAATARAARVADRTLCGAASVREALLELGAPAPSTVVVRGLLDAKRDLGGSGVFPPILDPRLRWVVSAAPCDGPDRGQGDLLLAFLSVARTRPRLHLLIGGAGPAARALAGQAELAGMRGRVVVHPLALEQLPGVFARAAAVVGPSRSGNLPDPLPEALAMGAPVIATAIGPHPNWIREGRTGWLVPARAPAALAARLAQLLDDPETARRAGAAAQKAALELSQPVCVALELARCYAGVGRPAPAPSTGIELPESARVLRV